jgi:hypothetical protein
LPRASARGWKKHHFSGALAPCLSGVGLQPLFHAIYQDLDPRRMGNEEPGTHSHGWSSPGYIFSHKRKMPGSKIFTPTLLTAKLMMSIA